MLGDIAPPELMLSVDGAMRTVGAQVVAVPFHREGDDLVLGPGAAEVLDEVPVDLVALLDRHRATGRAGDVVEHPVLDDGGRTDPALESVLLVGVGEGTPADFRRAGAALARRLKGRDLAATTIASLADEPAFRAFVEGVVLGSFSYHLKTSDQPAPLRRLVLAGMVRPESREESLARSVASAYAAWSSRVLALVPSNDKNPQWMVERAREVAAAGGLQVKVWDEKALAKEGFGGIVGVGQGSSSPPRLVQLGYEPPGAGRRTPHVVLVGKGITFDTGGLSIKPAEAMAPMKRDMTGAAVVLCAMGALAAMGCGVRVTGLLALAENAISGSAIRPGDVLRHYGGRTSEVTNTDAEGRLVLADALAYADARLDPTVLVDVATLTGAIKISLGQRTGGIFATDDGLAEQLIVAGTSAGEPLWRMPLVDEYEERLRSTVADADNAAGSPGAITAALFLRHFVGDRAWAHLDIASVGDSPTDAYEWSSGATGFGARLLLHWLEQRDPLAGVTRSARGRG